MSSHHIVRDAQEPALAILDSHCDVSLIKSLLEWSPTVIVTSDLVDFVIEEGFKIDVVIGDNEEMSDYMVKLQHQAPVKFLSKNASDNSLQQLIYFLTAGKYKAVNILASINPNLLESIMSFVMTIDVVIYDNGFKWYFCKAKTFKKWVSKGAAFRTLKALEISMDGTPIILSKSQTEYSCNCPEEGFITIATNKDGFWLGEAI